MKYHSGPPRPAAWAGLPLLLVAGCASRGPGLSPEVTRDATVVDARAVFHGRSALVLGNRHQRVTIVPALGRLMGIDFAGDGAASPGTQDPFWSHPQLGGALVPDAEGWINVGGDRALPAPQSDWPRVAGRGWPPPATFDAQPYRASIDREEVEIVSAVDPAYGIRVRRRMSLREDGLTINTTYEKVQGEPVRIAVWTIAELKPPQRVFVLLPRTSTFAGGFQSLLPARPREARVDGRLLSLARSPTDKTMIVSDGDALLWIGEGRSLLIEKLSESPSGEPRSWPDGAHAKIYTSPDGGQAYVELELLGPLEDLRPGQSTSMLVRYRLLRSVDADPLREAQAIFAKKLRE